MPRASQAAAIRSCEPQPQPVRPLQRLRRMFVGSRKVAADRERQSQFRFGAYLRLLQLRFAALAQYRLEQCCRLVSRCGAAGTQPGRAGTDLYGGGGLILRMVPGRTVRRRPGCARPTLPAGRQRLEEAPATDRASVGARHPVRRYAPAHAD